MDLATIIQAVQNIGISALMCLGMAWFVKYMFDKFMGLLEEEKEAHKVEVNLLKDALNNNTIALTRLSAQLEKGEK